MGKIALWLVSIELVIGYLTLIVADLPAWQVIVILALVPAGALWWKSKFIDKT